MIRSGADLEKFKAMYGINEEIVIVTIMIDFCLIFKNSICISYIVLLSVNRTVTTIKYIVSGYKRNKKYDAE